jgi:hypothetical protein
MIKDTLDSLGKWWNERTSSPLYATFAVTVILANWDIFYTLFWESETKFTTPRVEYVRYVLLADINFWELLHRFCLPVLSTYLIIKFLPRLSDWAFDVSQDFYYERLQKSDERKTKYLNKTAKEAVEQEKAVEVIEEVYSNGFKEFEKSKYFGDFGHFVYAALERKRLSWLDVEIVIYYRIQEIVKVDKAGLVDFTEKGNYFLKEYSNKYADMLGNTLKKAEFMYRKSIEF